MPLNRVCYWLSYYCVYELKYLIYFEFVVVILTILFSNRLLRSSLRRTDGCDSTVSGKPEISRVSNPAKLVFRKWFRSQTSGGHQSSPSGRGLQLFPGPECLEVTRRLPVAPLSQSGVAQPQRVDQWVRVAHGDPSQFKLLSWKHS